jgi:UDP-N-acetyl-D-mannosaminuronic acid dehydrogenase
MASSFTDQQPIRSEGNPVTEWSPDGGFERDVVVVGGCGHVGLPLAIALADRGAMMGIYDVSQPAVELVNAGEMPFAEPGAGDVLKRVVAEGRLAASVSPAVVASGEQGVGVIGTAVEG